VTVPSHLEGGHHGSHGLIHRGAQRLGQRQQEFLEQRPLLKVKHHAAERAHHVTPPGAQVFPIQLVPALIESVDGDDIDAQRSHGRAQIDWGSGIKGRGDSIAQLPRSRLH